MAYITQYNASRILKDANLQNIKIKNRGIFRRSIYFFNNFEETFLKVYQEMLENPDEFFSKVYSKFEEPKDNYFYLTPPKPPSYHEKSNCSFLNSDYKNFEIPKEIRKKGNVQAEEFRKWFATVQYLFDKDPEAFQVRLQARWGILVSIAEIAGINSGVSDIKNYDLETLVSEIDKLLIEARKFRYSCSKHDEILKRFQKKAYLALKEDPIDDNSTSYSDEEIKVILKEFELNYKRPIKSLLTEYYRVSLNPEMKFEGKLLDSIGFFPCSSCAGNFIPVDEVFK